MHVTTLSCILPLLMCISAVDISSSQGDDVVTVMYKKRLQHIAEMNYVGIISIENILDVGASDGYWSKFVSDLFPRAAFFLIEGNPYLHSTLEQTGLDFDISVVGSDAEMNDRVSFVRKQSGTSDGVPPKAEVEAEEEEMARLEGRVTTIDEVVRRRQLNPFQLLRFNLQGRELEALQGATQTLNTAEFVLLEVAVHQYHPGAASFSDFDAFLSQKGYRMYDIYDMRYSQPRTDMDPVYQVPTLVQYDVLWAKANSRVFRGAGFPSSSSSTRSGSSLDTPADTATPPPITRSTARRVVAVTKHLGGLAAAPLTSEPLIPAAHSTTTGKSSASDATNAQSSSVVNTCWRKKKKTMKLKKADA